ncbi:MAG TPA: hypothetical protein VN436_11930, partial [Holophaga sp.]|nr:hypothetical protein [Holophaga sp.]
MSSGQEKGGYERFAECMRNTPLPVGELAHNAGLYVPSKTMTRMLFFYELYKKLVNTHGVIIEFGVRWGQSLSILSALRGIFEPFNRHRKIIGFDTFEGFTGVSAKDGERSGCDDGAYSVPGGYEAHLAEILSLQEELNPISHLKKYELVKGDVRRTVHEYLARQPETVV